MVRHAVVGDRHAVVGNRQARPCNRSTRLAEPARPATGEPSRASAAGRARQSSRSLTTEPFQASNTNRHVIGAACAAVPGATATAAAHAQSSVALHGLLDASIAYTNTQSGKHAWQQGRGLPSNTVFGLRGSDGPGARLRVAPRAGRIVDAYASRGDDRHPASVPTVRSDGAPRTPPSVRANSACRRRGRKRIGGPDRW
ncbi:porin [Burkholderia pseudomallei]|nr:porin [Burkholderia pseudomallei]MDA5589786.1 porin [Burkholderia pseudomallei]WCE18557.1 porin [Burkholderia pseudomallei]WCK60925.1 porin [Burkholderia pseudomallei]